MATINQTSREKSKKNEQNNAKAVKVAADIASKSANPYAKAIGAGVKVADKISGGRASNFIGKRITKDIKRAPLGGLTQAALNKVASSGTEDRINAATSKKNNFFGGFFNNNQEEITPESQENVNNSSTNSENSSEETTGVFKASLKFVAIAMIGFTPILAGLVIVCLIMTASFVKLDLLGMGSADKTVEMSDNEIQGAFDKNEDETTTDVSIDYLNEETGQKESMLVYIARKKPKNEAKLEEITDYYPIIESYKEKYDENMLYNFFYKIHLISNEYRNKYNLNVDVPLLMATLMMQSEDRDMNIIFSSNLSSEDDFYNMEKSEIDVSERFSYDYDWSGYSTSKSNSAHDIEVLVQNMFSEQVKETCVDSSGKVKKENILRDEERENKTLTCEEGLEYKTEYLGMQKDDEKYKEFLEKFLYEKYILNDDDYSVTGSGTLGFGESYSDGNATSGFYVTQSEPDPSLAINYWSYVDSKDFVYPKDEKTGKSLGAWPKNYKSIPAQLDNPKTYQKYFIWPVTPSGGTYSYVYEHNGIDIMADFGEPIYSPVDAILVYSTWGHTTNRGSDETAYSVTLELEKPVKFKGVSIGHIFMTHMSGIRYRCEWGECNRKVKKGELLGFVGNAAGSAESPGWATHLHMTYYPYDYYSGGLYTTNMEKLYNIKSGTKRKAGG